MFLFIHTHVDQHGINSFVTLDEEKLVTAPHKKAAKKMLLTMVEVQMTAFDECTVDWSDDDSRADINITNEDGTTATHVIEIHQFVY